MTKEKVVMNEEGLTEEERDFKRMEEEMKQAIYERFERGETAREVEFAEEIGRDESVSFYESWKQSKMDNLTEGDRVSFILKMNGYDSKLVEGNVYKKHTNAVIVDCSEDAYIRKNLRGRVAVSVKDILKL